MHALFPMLGGGALAVSSRILSIFERKKFVKSVAVCDNGVHDCDVFSHRAFGSFAFAVIVSDQYST